MHKQPATILLFLCLLASSAPVRAHEVAEQMAAAANDFLASLEPAQREKCTFALDDEERTNWHYVPVPRKGLSLREMEPDQRLLAHGLLSTGLSHTGYLKAVQIMSLEQILFELENQDPKRDPQYYLVWIFGKPSAEGTWGWRFEGHHMSLNFTIVKGKLISETPAFWASNPGEVPQDRPRAGLRVLAGEEDLARELVKSLDDAQKAQALIADTAPKDILTKDLPKVDPLADEGIAYSALKPDQQTKLWAVIDEYLGNHRDELAAEERERVKSEQDAIKFGWAGGLEFGEGHYYFIQGKTFLLEYCNIQNGAMHPHAAWRNFGEDFGIDLLRRHLQAAHAE